MATCVTYFIFLIWIINTYSNILICDKDICDLSDTCPEDICENTNYICTDKVSQCNLECDSDCNNINITSSAQNTTIECNTWKSCENILITIIEPTSYLSLECNWWDSCLDINIQCLYSNPNQCQCSDPEWSKDCDYNVQFELYSTPTSRATYNPTPRPTNSLQISIPNPSISTILPNISDHTQTREPNENDVADNNNNTNSNSNSKHKKAKFDMIIIIICVVSFWCLICISVPIYLYYWKKNKRNNRKETKPEVALQPMQSNSIIKKQEPNGFDLEMPGFTETRSHKSSEGLVKSSKSKQRITPKPPPRGFMKRNGLYNIQEETKEDVSDDELDESDKCEYDKLYEGKQGGVETRGKVSEDNEFKPTPDGLKDGGLPVPDCKPLSADSAWTVMTLELPQSAKDVGDECMNVLGVNEHGETVMPTEAAIIGSLGDDENIGSLYGPGVNTAGVYLE